MKAFSLKLPDPLFHDLAKRARSSATSQSDIMRAALTAYLRGDAAEPQTDFVCRACQPLDWHGVRLC